MRNKYIQLELNDKYDVLIKPDIDYGHSLEGCKILIGTTRYVNVDTGETYKLSHFLPNLRMELDYLTSKAFETFIHTNFESILDQYGDSDYLEAMDNLSRKEKTERCYE